MIHRPRLSEDPDHNRRLLQEALDTPGGGKLELPTGTHPLTDGLVVPAGWTIRGAETTAAGGGRPTTWLHATGTTGHPLLHVRGSDVSIGDLGLRPPPADPGEHGGDRGTAITVGDYLYPHVPTWIGAVDIRRVHVVCDGRAANSIALMGAVRDVTVHDVTVHGGHTGVAVHWGAVGADVSTIVGPTYHPHRLTITDLRVRDAVEGFYLSSVHDVRVLGACLRDVDMGFRLLPGDNTDRFVADPRIGSRIEIADVCVRWTGADYGARIAGWGRSEVDGVISTLRYRDTVVRDCILSGHGSATWSPLLAESADGVDLRGIRVQSAQDSARSGCCVIGTQH